MFVIRIDDADEHDFKAYSSERALQGDLNRARLEVYEGAYQAVSLYHVPWAGHTAVAIEAVRNAAEGIRLMNIWESEKTSLDRMIKKILPHMVINI